MKTHKFDVADAEKYGVKKAIILEHLKYHQESNTGNSECTFDGKPYAYLKKETIEKMFPYLNYKSVKRWLNEFEDEGIIKSIKPGRSQGKHLKYYHVVGHNLPNSQNEKSKSQNESSARNNNDGGFSQNENSSIVTNVNKPNEGESFSKRLQNADDKQALLEVWLAYRRKKNKHATNFEKDVILNQDWKGKTVDRIREAIKYTVSNGWISLQWPEVEESQGQMSYHKELK